MSRPETDDSPLDRYIPLLAWLVTVATLLFIPLKILSHGYVAGGDARRHVAIALTDKSLTDVVVLGPEYVMDHSPGWDVFLKFLHRELNWDEDHLMSFSVAALMLCFFFAPLPWLRRPEAWLAALLAELVALPGLMIRLTQARPYLLTEAVLLMILYAWSRPDDHRPSAFKLTLTTLGIALSVWMHGAWYLWVLPLAAFFLSRAWRTAFALTACFIAGIIAGAVFTGKPIAFLRQAVAMAALVQREHVPQWLLVGEFRPSDGEFESVALVALVIMWQWLRRGKAVDYLRQPAFCLMVLCWVLGLKADRFWADWGVAGLLVWLTMQFEELLPTLWRSATPKRVVACVLIALPLFLQATNDINRRYSYNLTESTLDASDPALKGWLPESGGIFYSAQMAFFYNTFYKNPDADWRYILAFEPAEMPPDDLITLRKIQTSNGAFADYEPWVKKLRPGDRLEIDSYTQPNIPELEWRNATGNIWIGRKPKTAAH